MIDLHLHTTASDGAWSPSELVARAEAAGLATIAVTDHDTMAAVPEVEAFAREAGLGFVPGIEITSVWSGRDVHLLAYFLDCRSARVDAFLSARAGARTERALRIAERLEALGAPLDVDALFSSADLRSIGRPAIARALVDAGHVPTTEAAFDQYLAAGAPAWVQHAAGTPHDVIAFVREEGGLVSFAHPGVTDQDELLDELGRNGLHAVEAYHPEHDRAATARYLAFARDRGLAVTGGSDCHGDETHRAAAFGSVTLSAAEFERFSALRGSHPSVDAAAPGQRPSS